MADSDSRTPDERADIPVAQVTIFAICDHADIVNGKLYALGLGWNWCRTPTPPSTLVTRTLVAPSRFHSGTVQWQLHLEDADGHPLPLGAALDNLVQVSGTAPQGALDDSELPVWTLFHLPPLALPPGRYQWRITVNEVTATYPFLVINTPTAS